MNDTPPGIVISPIGGLVKSLCRANYGRGLVLYLGLCTCTLLFSFAHACMWHVHTR